MAGKNGRAITREDLNDSIQTLGTLVDSKLDRVLDKVASLREDIRIHAENVQTVQEDVKHRLSSEIGRMDTKHDVMQADLESLKKYRWMVVGALAIIGLAWEYLSHWLLKK